MPAKTLAQLAYDILLEWDAEFFRSDAASHWPNNAGNDILELIETYSDEIGGSRG